MDRHNNEDVFSLYCTKYQTNLRGLFLFEITSLIGRLCLNKKPPLGRDKNYLNLGCGASKFEGWVNADFFKIGRLWKNNSHLPDWEVDLRFPLNCNDNVWDGVFSEHVLEHLYPNQVLALLKELYRTMKQGAWIRLSVPDLAKHINYYNGEKGNEVFDIFPTGCEAIFSLTQNWGHRSVWDYELLKRLLEDSGFSNIKSVEYREGTDQNLLKDSEDRRPASLYIEARKAFGIFQEG